MALIDKYAVGTNPGFRSRVEMALVAAAVAVMTESVATPGHTERAAYATRVLDAPATMSGPAAIAVATGFLDLTASDGDVEFTVQSMLNALAGYSAAP